MATTFYLRAESESFIDTVPGDTVAQKRLGTSTGTTTTLSSSLDSSNLTRRWFFNTVAVPSSVPGSTSWATGNWTCEINVTTALSRADVRFRLHRYNFNGSTLEESSSWSAVSSIGTTGVKTLSLTSVSWGSPKGPDRIAVEVEFTKGTVDGSFGFDVGDTNAEVASPLTLGYVQRPTPVAASAAPVGNALGLALTVQPTTASMASSAVAMALALAYTLTPTPAAVTMAAVDPTLALGGITLLMETAAASAVPVDPALALAYSIEPTPVAATMANVDPALALALTVAPSPAAASLSPVDPSLSMALNVALDTAAVTLAPVDPALDLALNVATTPASMSALAVDPALVLALTIAPTSAAITASPVALSIDFGVAPSVVGPYFHIADTLRERFQALVGDVAAVTVLYDDELDDTVSSADVYVRLSLELIDAEQIEVGPANTHRKAGTATARIRVRHGIGDGLAWSVADTINDAFRMATAADVHFDPPPYPILRGIAEGRWELVVEIPFYYDPEITPP